MSANSPDRLFIHESLPESDRDLFFGPLDGTEEFIVFPEGTTMAHVLSSAGIFKSVTEARKNGGNRCHALLDNLCSVIEKHDLPLQFNEIRWACEAARQAFPPPPQGQTP